MVHIFHYHLSSGLPAPVFNRYLETLPPDIQKKIRGYRQWQDAERSLAGYILLQKGLENLNLPPIDFSSLTYGEFRKPGLDNIHFNITHSGDFTVCAISKDQEVGIDIELISDIPLGDFTEFFNATEWHGVLNAPDSMKAFYQLWTKKEAFLKLVGSGLNEPLNKVNIDKGLIHWSNQHFVLQEVDIDPLHVCHLCTAVPAPGFTISGVFL